MTQLTEQYTLEILHLDEYLIFVHKQAGLLVHPSWITPPGEVTLVGLLKEQFPDETIHTVHRLDKATSGVMVFARNKEVAQALQQKFRDRQVSKTYLCVVRGWTEAEGTIDYALKPVYDKFADPLANPDKAPKDAVTHFRQLGCVELPIPVGKYPVARYSVVEVKPETGRKHQIRRHMKHIFHPLVGDTNHGEGRHNRLFRETFGCYRLLLMAIRLELTHPVTERPLSITAHPGEQINQLFAQLGWSGLIEKEYGESMQ
ncbi:pseudouridine synthase [Nitrincola sp. MINF-07-Sa-05]|uniref:pseudouridine synthase n=1 Tax=Nitrincola salilacus TaxID=3400273 RepID=UPI0039182976